VYQSIIFVTFIIAIKTALAVGRPSTTNATTTPNVPPHSSNHSYRGRRNGTLENVSCGATSGAFLRDSVVVLTAHRWQRMALAVRNFRNTHGQR